MKKRVCKLVIALCLIFGLGMGYAFFFVKTGIAIPCMFHLITGLYCPGCGVSRMCLSILQGDFQRAFFYNPMLFLMLPLLVFYFIRQAVNYIRGVKWQMSKWESVVWKVLVVVLIIFGVVRNLPGMQSLLPR